VCQVDPEPHLVGSTHRDSGGFGDITTMNNWRSDHRSGPRPHSQSEKVAAIAPDKVAEVIAGALGTRGTRSQLPWMTWQNRHSYAL